MANPVGSPCTLVSYQQPNAGVTISRHAGRWTAVFPAGVSVAYVPVGQLAGDDLILVNQRAQLTGLQIKPSRSLQVNDNFNGFAEFVTEDNVNASASIAFDFTILRNA